MSKIEYSKLISEILDEKISNLQNYKVHEFFKRDEYFEVALCLTYLVLTKEQIIEKDLKEEDRLARLHKMVDISEIKKVFDPSFNPEMPVFDESVTIEKDLVWRLDNIRDSIMHSKLDVDLDNKCFILDNPQSNRRMKVSLPFSWVIKYAKNDILSKKLATKYGIRGLFYNKDKEYHFVNPRSVIEDGIVYNAYIKSSDGKEFNARQVEDRIRYLFDLRSDEEVDLKYLSKARTRNKKSKKQYDENYLARFLETRAFILKELKRDFPNLDVEINITDRKYSIIKKMKDKFNALFDERYSLVAYEINRMIAPKTTSILRYLSNIIDTFDHNIYEKYPDDNRLDAIAMFNDAINNLTPLRQTYGIHKEEAYTTNYNLYLSVLLSVYGINTLVINHEDGLYNDVFGNMDPNYFVYEAKTKQPFLNYAERRTSIKKRIFEKENALLKKQNELLGVPEERKSIVQGSINNLSLEIDNLKNELFDLSKGVGYSLTEPYSPKLIYDFSSVANEIVTNETEFYNSKDIKKREKLCKKLSNLYKELGEIESKYVYSTENSMSQILTVIRNALSHPGRINVDGWNNVYLYDYNEEGKKSGEVHTNFGNLGEIFKKPLEEKNQTMVL